MIKNFEEYITESANGFNKGDVVEVMSIFGEAEDLNDRNSKYIGRLYVVDSADSDSVKVLDGGVWATRDVRKLTPQEIEKRSPEIKEIIEAWEGKKKGYKKSNIKGLQQDLKLMANNLNYINESMVIIEDVKTDKHRYKLTLNIQKVD